MAALSSTGVVVEIADAAHQLIILRGKIVIQTSELNRTSLASLRVKVKDV
jgi:hypothetical protein